MVHRSGDVGLQGRCGKSPSFGWRLGAASRRSSTCWPAAPVPVSTACALRPARLFPHEGSSHWMVSDHRACRARRDHVPQASGATCRPVFPARRTPGYPLGADRKQSWVSFLKERSMSTASAYRTTWLRRLDGIVSGTSPAGAGPSRRWTRDPGPRERRVAGEGRRPSAGEAALGAARRHPAEWDDVKGVAEPARWISMVRAKSGRGRRPDSDST